MVTIRILRAPQADPDLPLPRYETSGAAGADIRADLHARHPNGLTLAPGERCAIPTGLCIAIPKTHEVQIRPRSGLALRHGLSLVNSPGTIDSDYRGEVKVIAINLGQDALHIAHGDRIAQMVVAPVVQADWQEVDALDDTDRGAGGFGSTGRRE